MWCDGVEWGLSATQSLCQSIKQLSLELWEGHTGYTLSGKMRGR